MRNSLRHILAQPFVVATGFAALIHSTWSLAVLFNGHEPEAFSSAWFAWLAPALLIALSIDLGQVVTASEIRNGQRSRIKLATFATFAIATYGLQWYHLAHHSPMLALADGVRLDWQPFAQWISDAMLWFVPALLPLSTLLYTFSSSEPLAPVASAEHASHSNQIAQFNQALQVNVALPSAPPVKPQIAERTPEIESAKVPIAEHTPEVHPAKPQIALPMFAKADFAEISQSGLDTSDLMLEGIWSKCPHCDWLKRCASDRQSTNSLNAHLRHCKNNPANVAAKVG